MQTNRVLHAVTAVLDWDMPNETCSEAVTRHLLDHEEGWEGWDRYGIDTTAH